MQDDATGLDQTLEGEGWLGRVAIPPDQRRAFAGATHSARRRALVLSLLVGLGFYLAFTPGDLFAVPDQLELALMLRFGVMLPLGLLVIVWLRRTRCSLRCQQCVTCAFHLSAVALLAVLMMRSDSVNALGFVFANYAILVAMVISMALPIRLVMVLAVIVVLIQAVAIAHGPLQLPALEIHNLMIAVVIIGPALFANRTLENERRRHFLLLQREALQKRQLAEQRDLLARLAALDPLTDIANRRGFHAAMRGDLEWARPEAPVALAMIDIDYFKPYNDHYGHAAGDDALRRVAQTLAETARPLGRAGRMGGEEFAVIVTGLDGNELARLAERLRAGVQRLGIQHHHGTSAGVVTISVGVALLRGTDVETSALFEAADAALYQAKAAGRNRVVIHDLSRPEAGVRQTG